MTSIAAASSSSRPVAAERSQYHHFIPQFLLRNFAQDRPQNTRNSSQRQPRKDGVLRFISTEHGDLSSRLVSRHYGFKDMYRDMYAAEQHGLEKKFSYLEGRAAEIIRKAKTTFLQPGATLTLTRTEKDTLRKFLFLMKYRNTSFGSRFDVPTINEYTTADKGKIARYMQARGFRSPRAVWLANMHTFLDITIDPQRMWHSQVRRQAYSDDATLFIIHMEQSYMAFCKPQCAGDEFLLSQNAFGISEGPNSRGMDPATGELDQEILTEWHNFAPLSPTLLIILRNNCLPGNEGATTIEQNRMYDLLRFMHPSPEEAGSMLQDLPVRRCTPSYLNQESGRLVVTSNHHEPSPSDRYEFECFELGSPHVDLINSIFLEEALPTQSIVFKRDTVAARAIHKYIEDPRPGFKAACRDDSDKYLTALETALQKLGGRANTVRNTPSLPIQEQLPLDFAEHMARWVTFHTAIEINKHHPRLLELYQSLGGSTIGTPRALQQWYYDVQQAAKITFLYVKTKIALSAMALDDASKRRCETAKMNFLATLHPRFIWLFVKALQNLDKLDPHNITRPREPLRCEGVEDEVVRGKSGLPPNSLSAALLLSIGEDRS